MATYRTDEVKTLGVSKVYQKGKTQIPRSVRKLLEIKDGDRLIWTCQKGLIVIKHESA